VTPSTSQNTSILFHQSLEEGQFQKRYLMATKKIYNYMGYSTSMSSRWLDIGQVLFVCVNFLLSSVQKCYLMTTKKIYNIMWVIDQA